MIDLRSDTVTRPTSDMKEAMFQAMVGDDVYGEDPTINALQEKAAKMFGMEAALFCPSGTMCNQVAIKLSTQPQDEVICDKWAHVYLYEGGGMMANSMVSVRLLDGDRMRISPQQVEAAINPENLHFPISRLVCLENTCNKGGGSYYTMDEIKAISEVCRDNHLRLHVDGARIFNALTETGDDPRDYGKYINTLSFCLSKGLGAPVGSMLVGSHDDIKKALRIRKMLGGGMRQAGYLAAAGLYALEHHIERLTEDHQRAQKLGEVLQQAGWVKELMPVETNILVFAPDPAYLSWQKLVERLDKAGILVSVFGNAYIRMVTHLDINDDDLDQVIGVLEKI
ncbi:MAG: aminotransferase class I/II-fold pyridoxal phosphate-dependent enzyme [Bacteroidetes bacterium]|nr:aminotransferase class I/II-fold pyridoxal phosphate-dependent enzyme [Bacteroidota bacterium]